MADHVRAPMSTQDVRRAYARWAKIYDWSFARIVRRGLKQAVASANESASDKGGQLLELGVGTGVALPLYRRELEITGIDLSPEMLARASALVKRKNLANVRALKEMDAEQLDFADESFDIVVAAYVMTVVPAPEKALAEIMRVCRPGGTVIIVNHFKADGGLRQRGEKLLAPLSRFLGWHPDFPKSMILDKADDMELLEERAVPPFGIFTLLRFRKKARGKN